MSKHERGQVTQESQRFRGILEQQDSLSLSKCSHSVCRVPVGVEIASRKNKMERKSPYSEGWCVKTPRADSGRVRSEAFRPFWI